MTPQEIASPGLFSLFGAGGFAMYPLLICSLAVWWVIFERLWRFRRLDRELQAFHHEAVAALLRGEPAALKALCALQPDLPSAKLVMAALERLESKDSRLRATWQEALERKRRALNQDLRRGFWILGTVGSASPFIGLFGTVVGILQSFGDIARTGSGGFAVVAAGISEALIATAAGIVVAVIAVLAYNAFQTRWASLVLVLRSQAEELAELLDGPR